LPLTKNLVKYLTFHEIEKNEGSGYARMCIDELNYLNSENIHDKIQDKMQACVYGKESTCMEFRVDYPLAIKNVKEYNELKQYEQSLIKNKSRESGQGGLSLGDK
jgi:hypothetical protein